MHKKWSIMKKSMDYLLWVVVDELSVDEHVHVMLANHFNLKKILYLCTLWLQIIANKNRFKLV